MNNDDEEWYNLINNKKLYQPFNKFSHTTQKFSDHINTINDIKRNNNTITKDNNSLLSKNMIKKMKSGIFHIDSTLDLHYYTVEDAFYALKNFIHKHYFNSVRNLLIITGKGIKNQGKIRERLPIWIDSIHLKHYILSFHTSHIKHGGSGAYYIILRKKR